ncbi:uncharacterized protein LOC110839463 [Zootermopsis nevadensis]|uniref:Protein G12 n=1 Tax=Zootermopsis nevadensis TaxID=136037 RepID=A0A067QVM1_ZOONE|nr:uncharacterized protein LOC110839463 [Zootermopsis nevadensis]KDR08524.1 Protein G12 [Zootermopsis nevadensis]
MKLSIIFLAVVGLACGKSLPTRSLQDDLNDFLALVPLDEVLGIALDYLANDEQVQDFVVYLQSEEFHKIILTVEDVKELKDFLKFINDLGIDVYEILNQVHEILGLPPFKPDKHSRRGVGINGLINDVIAVLPTDKLKELFEEKKETSEDFKALIAAIQSPEFSNIVDALRAIKEYQDLLESLRNKGVDVDNIIALFRALFGLSRRGTRNLQDDLNDVLAHIPLDEVLAIGLDYLANDQEVQELVIYLQSAEFHKIVLTVEAVPEFDEALQFVTERGIDAKAILDQIHEILGLPPRSSSKITRRGSGIQGLIDDLVAVIHVDHLKELFEEKLQTSQDVKDLVDFIRSSKFEKILSTLRSIKEYQDLLQSLREKGVDVDGIIKFLKDLLGLARHY